MSKYQQIRKMDISNGVGIGVSIFFSGCDFKCKNCFNSDYWDKNSGFEFTKETIYQIEKYMNKDYITRLSILGGDGLMPYNVKATLSLIANIRARYPQKKIWVYSGYTYDELFLRRDPDVRTILQNIDVLVDGRFVDELKDLSLPFRGSSNQRIINVPETLKTKDIVLLDI